MLTRALDVCAVLGGETVSFWSGPLRPGVDADRAWEWLEAGVAELVRRAGARGVTASFEPEPGHLTELLTDYDRLAAAAPGLRLALDTGHLLVTGEADPAGAIRERADQIGTVAVEQMERGVHLHKPFGTGDVDVPSILRALADVRFGGLVTVELSRESPRAHLAIPESIAYLKSAESA
jgi:sugar phosphate isomerase/epimerase